MDKTMRCDRCGAQAYFVVMKITQELFFCRHHYLKHEKALKQWSSEVIDHSDTLEKAPA
jgi:ribosomal protein L37E